MLAQGATGSGDASRDVIRQRSAQIVLIEDATGLGTGVLVGPDGWVLTNKHVAPSLGPYRVILADGKDVRGVGVHQSPHHDLAIVKMAAAQGSFLDISSEVADEYVVGEEVFALGHPRGCRFSVARGIISNPHREIEKEYYVQTDVSINPGNSGGPLVDRSGRLVGIVTMMMAYSQGLGFAVPGHIAADYVRHVRRLVRSNVVRIPEELLHLPEEHRVSTEETVRAAVGTMVHAGRAAIEEEKPEEGYFKLKHKSAVVEVRAKDGLFEARAQVAALGPAERRNAAFLARLLELSGTQELGGASFVVREGGLFAAISRRAAGLDRSEAVWAIDLVAHLGTEAPPKITTLLFGTPDFAAGQAPTAPPMTQGYPQAPMYPGPPAAPPTPMYPGPPAAAPAAADPGYPILQMPATTGWK